MKTKVFPAQQMLKIGKTIGIQIEQQRRDLLQLLGVRLLSFIKQAYIQKSRGGTGDDGIVWKPLKPETILAKNRRTGKGKKKKKKTTTASGKVRPSFSSSGIGIDTGLQQSSSSPGFIGPDGKGGNVFSIDDVGVTVGFGRAYSTYFDEDRKLVPTSLPDKWREEMERLAANWGIQIVGSVLI